MRIGIVSTRICGSDGVSLEIGKWSAILRQSGHELFYCAGELEPGLAGKLIPAMHFLNPEVDSIQHAVFGQPDDPAAVKKRIERLREELYREMADFLDRYHIEVLIVENAFSIPMNVPLAFALRDLLADRHLPAIAHHHDFIWERERFAESWMMAELEQVFPPDAAHITHVVINSLARAELLRRTGIQAEIIPNIFDFTHFHYGLDKDNIGFRRALGVGRQDWLLLQPTRIVPRKGIEHAIDLVSRLREPAHRARLMQREVKLVLSHPSGDEGGAYFKALKQQARACGVPLVYAAGKIALSGSGPKQGGKFRLWDAYLNADFVTYPSLIEGFGNAFLEAVFFRLPLLVRRYPVFVSDIEPLGFDLVKFDEKITEETVEDTLQVILDPIRRRRMVEWNFNLARIWFSYQALSPKLAGLLERCRA
jgi:glycosyltransferase involved in cell wall biosynthesis